MEVGKKYRYRTASDIDHKVIHVHTLPDGKKTAVVEFMLGSRWLTGAIPDTEWAYYIEVKKSVGVSGWACYYPDGFNCFGKPIPNDKWGAVWPTKEIAEGHLYKGGQVIEVKGIAHV